MDQETTHTRISAKSATMLNQLSEQTGIPRTKLLDAIVGEVLAAIESTVPIGELAVVAKLRVLSGKPTAAASISARMDAMEANLKEISKGNYDARKK